MIFCILHSNARMPDALEYDVSENSVEFFFVELLNFSTKLVIFPKYGPTYNQPAHSCVHPGEQFSARAIKRQDTMVLYQEP